MPEWDDKPGKWLVSIALVVIGMLIAFIGCVAWMIYSGFG